MSKRATASASEELIGAQPGMILIALSFDL